MADMLETMYAAPGIGLAAPQVGVGLRVIVLDVAREGEPKAPMKLANPEIVWASDDDASYEEGCLSVPEHYAEVVRPRAVKVRYLDEGGAAREIEAEGLLATCLQHEIDHLDGILFLDHLSALKRNMILRKLLKEKKRGDEKGAKDEREDSPRHTL
jgi:peptide deformylase